MEWNKITNIILGAAFAVLVVFVILGLAQWIQRKSLKKVDKQVIGMIFPLLLMAITYFVFDKIWIVATRPNGSGEPSFPSTHAMVVATIFALAAVALPKYIKQKPLRITLYVVMLSLTVLVCVGRVAANMHSVTDVVCGVVFAGIFAGFYYLITRETTGGAKHSSAKNLTKKEQHE